MQTNDKNAVKITGNPGSVIVPQYVSSKIQCLYGVKI